MRQFYLVRHAQSLGNAGVPDAGPNPGLTDLGRAQAAALAQRLTAGGPIDLIWSSPFARAVETACAVAEAARVPVVLVPGLHEYFHPGWFDLDTLRLPSLAEIAASRPSVHADSDGDHWWPHQDESEEALRARLAGVAGRLVADAPEGRTVVVGHGASVAMLAEALLPGRRTLIQDVANASVTEIWCQGRDCAMACFNDATHCPEG